MKLGPIVLKIRLAETLFGNMVAGAAEMDAATEDEAPEEAAYVIQLAETASPNQYDTTIKQTVTETFGVAVCLRNDLSQRDKLGLTAYDKLFDVRKQLFHALLGWMMPGADSLVEYSGGRLLSADRAYLWYLFEFSVEVGIDLESDGTDEGYSELGSFDQIYAEYILAPSTKLPVNKVGGAEYALTIGPDRRDAVQNVDLTVDLKAGEYSRAYRVIEFDVYTGG